MAIWLEALQFLHVSGQNLANDPLQLIAIEMHICSYQPFAQLRRGLRSLPWYKST